MNKRDEKFIFLGDLNTIIRDIEDGNIFDFLLYVYFTESRSDGKIKMLAVHRGGGYTIIAVLPYMHGWMRTAFRFTKNNRLQFIEEHVARTRLVSISTLLDEKSEAFVYGILNDAGINAVDIYVDEIDDKPHEVFTCSFPITAFLDALAREKYALALREERVDVLRIIYDIGVGEESVLSADILKHNILSLLANSGRKTEFNSKMLQPALLDAGIEITDLLSVVSTPEAYINMLAKLFIVCVSRDGDAGNFLALCRLLADHFDNIAENLVTDEPSQGVCFRLTTIN